MLPKPKTDTLILREWVCFCLIIGFILSIFIIECAASFSGSSAKNSLIASKKKIEITLIGALKEPGTYSFEPGVSLGKVLKKKKLLSTADRKKLPSKKILLCSQTIEIPYRDP